MATINIFQNRAAYNAAAVPTTATRVGLIQDENEVKVDGVNVITREPETGDAIYINGSGEKVAIKGSTLNASLINANWTYKGVFLYNSDKGWVVFMGNYSTLPSLKYLDVCQYAITAISGASLSIKLRMAPDYSVDTTISVTLSSATINATSAQEISAAVAAKATAVGDTNAWWAYLADANGNKVTSGGTRIIIQCDTCADYRFYNVSATGCTIAHVSWGDMPENSAYLKSNGRTTNYMGLMNFEGAISYWSTNGRTLAANVAVHSESGNTSPMSLNEFNTSSYAAEIKAYYGTYEAYLRGEFGILTTKYGAFALPSAKELTEKYGAKTAPTKGGSTKAMYPALAWALAQGGYMWGIQEGVFILEDSHLNLINATQSKAGKAQITNSSHKWFAQRYNVNAAWFFHGSYRGLRITNVNSSYQVGAVTLL